MTCPRVLLACGLLAVLPLPALAQGRTCELMPGASEAHRNETETGQVFLYVSGRARWVCTGGISVQADSAVGQPATGMLELIGRVVYRDSIKTLTAGWLKYFGEQERLLARENVVLTDQSTGSVVQGPELEYERQTATRPAARTIVRGRPHALFYAADSTGAVAGSTRTAPGSAVPDGRSRPPEPEPELRTPGPAPLASDSAPPPLEVDADHMEILGQNSFHASGRVELSRGEMHGFGTEATFDQRSGRLLLRDEARIESERFTLFGEQIVGRLVRDTLREVVARQDALLLAEELELQAPELRIFFEEGEMNRLVAWSGVRRAGESSRAAGDSAANPARADSAVHAAAGDPAAKTALPNSAARAAAVDSAAHPAMPDSAGRVAGRDLRARALASGFRLIADSIDARAPGQRIDRVIAVGEAYAERTVDTLSAGLPEVASHDWLQGDTIIGYLRTDTVVAARATAREPADDVIVAAANDTAVPAPNDTAARPGWSVAAPGDSTIVRQVLERIVAVGSEGMARSIYRLPEQADSAEATEADRVERPAINYLIAQRITLFLENGAIENVEADGPIEGYHLQPRPPNDTTDSAGVAAPADTAGSAAPGRANTAQGAPGGATAQVVPRPGTGPAGVTRQPAKPERGPVE